MEKECHLKQLLCKGLLILCLQLFVTLSISGENLYGQQHKVVTVNLKNVTLLHALEYLTNVMKRRCTAFLLSDFIDQGNFKNAMTIANRKHDMVAIQVYDRRVEELPAIGLTKIKDAETGHEQWIDTSSRAVRRAHHDWWVNKQVELNETFTKSNVDNVSVRTDQDYVKALMNLFAKRN